MKLHGNLLYKLIFIMYVMIREDLSKLSYTTMCIKETLRMYPLAPVFSKMLSEDVVASGYKVPKGRDKISTYIYTLCGWYQSKRSAVCITHMYIINFTVTDFQVL